jgi:ribonuclease HI
MEPKLYFDGACEPRNPGGVATWGIVVQDGDSVIHRDCGLACVPYTPEATNNVAEYTALIRGLEWCLGNVPLTESLIVYGDSQLVVFQMLGKYAVRSPRVIPLYRKARSLASRFNKIRFEWVRREKNEAADKMSKAAYEQFRSESKRATTAARTTVSSMIPESGIIEQVLFYRNVGLSVIPVTGPHYTSARTHEERAKQSKAPLVQWIGYQSRFATDEEIESWFTKWPKANIGFVTGRISGVVVADFDSQDAVITAKAAGLP